nr:phage portal protein [Rhodococcus sp. (in: high G+C Gram-positive bacteria)]
MATENEANQLPPEEWFEHLMGKFDQEIATEPRASSTNTPGTRRERLQLLWDYYVGNAPLPYINDKYQPTFEQVMRKARVNFATMAVDVMTDRSILLGVTTDADNDIDGDDIARAIQEESAFASMQRDLQTYLYTMGEAYVTIVPPLEGADAPPMMIAEDPRRCVGQPDPLNPTRLLAGVKVYTDEMADQEVALLYVDGQQIQFLREPGQYSTSFNIDEWTQGETLTLAGLELLGNVPMVKFTNKMGLGEFEPNVDLLDRIMDGILQRIVIMWYQSFRQRAIKGDLDGGEDFSDVDETNSLIRNVSDDQISNLFQADPGALWIVPEGVDFWESNQADLTPQLNAIRDDVKEFAAATRTPMHIITPDAANQTAEGATLMREALVDKITDRQARQDPAWKLAYKIAFALFGQDTRGVGIKLTWGKVDRNSLAMKADAMAKTKGILSRKRQLIEIMEMDPTTAALNEAELIQETMLLDEAGAGGVQPARQATGASTGAATTPSTPAAAPSAAASTSAPADSSAAV